MEASGMWSPNKKSGSSRPIRRTWRCFLRFHPKTGEPMQVPICMKETELSPEGSPDTTETLVLQFFDCGHAMEQAPAGQCFDCKALSCNLCHGQCAQCGKPQCLECSQYLMEEEGCSLLRLCHVCADELKRKTLWKKIGQGVVSFLSLGKRPKGRR
jgi:hypothetical protein